MDFHMKNVCLLLLASLALTLADPQPLNTNAIGNEIDDKIPEKPESRQIGAVMPYNWIQSPQAVQMQAPAPSSWSAALSPSWLSTSGQSLLSMLKPNVVGGRRSSLSSRLRNLMNALFYSGSFFRRETTSPYMPSGSSYSYAFRPPPFNFGTGFSTSGLGGGLGSGLGGGLGSGIGSSLGSALGNQNLYGSASSYRPVVLPNYGGSASDAWSTNYKQFGSNGAAQTPFSGTASWNSGNTGGSPASSSSIWPSGSGSGSGSQYPGLSSSYPSYSSGGSGRTDGSNSAYQAAASNAYPSNTSYQRSSVSAYSKPQTSVNTSVSSSVSSSSSSSSSTGAAKSPGFQ